MMKKSLHNQRGFTLLELMLVIAIIAVITLLALTGYEQRTMNRKVAKASVEMQMWLQAGLQYCAHDSCQTQTAEDITQKIIDKGYMQEAQLLNPWAVSVADGSYKVSLVLDKEAIQLRVATTIPTYIDNSESVARILAGKLPFGQWNSGSSEAYMDVNPMDSSSNNGNTIIEKVVNIDRGKVGDIKKPTNCPVGYAPKLYVGLSDFKTRYTNHGATTLLSGTAKKNYNQQNNQKWSPYADITSGGGSGEGGVLAIVTCEKNNIANSATNSNYVF